jgi:hypothetical protein
MYYAFILIIFSFVCYSATQMLVYLNGPFHIFEKFRNLMQRTNEQLGELIGCEACTSTWVSFIISAINLIFIPSVAFTPFNLLLGGSGLWWLIILLDGLFGSGVAWLLFRLEDYLVNNTQNEEDYE